jgi:hypothetical protein
VCLDDLMLLRLALLPIVQTIFVRHSITPGSAIDCQLVDRAAIAD